MSCERRHTVSVERRRRDLKNLNDRISTADTINDNHVLLKATGYDKKIIRENSVRWKCILVDKST
jgi:hypothetical protein